MCPVPGLFVIRVLPSPLQRTVVTPLLVGAGQSRYRPQSSELRGVYLADVLTANHKLLVAVEELSSSEGRLRPIDVYSA